MARAVATAVLLAVLLAVLAACGAPPAGPTSASVAPQPCSPSVAITGFSDVLDGREYGARRTWSVAGLSGLGVDRDGALLALGDRSVLFTLDPRTREPTGVTPLADEDGAALDTEGLAVDADGTRLVATERAPAVHRYDRDGRLLGRLDVPAGLADRAAGNASLEGVAVLAPGGPVVAAMEGPLDGDDPAVRRIVTWPGPQWAYLPDPGLDVAELAATGDGRLLVVERSYTRGVGNTVHLALADPRGAADVTGTPELPPTGGPAPIARALLADLGACPDLGATAAQAQPNPLLDNVEGMTVLGRTPDGALRVLLVSDDNQDPEQTTRLYDLLVRLPPT
ncbi:esterase-like activity of phytase family protein [Actinomycetospora lemnae]|uniref:Esterase-like activity of phytase family protein n=1 Tax=Actinomycetospora lemnae TaxID=3019891 RepID=A0ABT5SN12_9PSEU|nr:esterase-like activity of phytase family protein [Actinomycetospora sp. DW7H6]MDD7964174.1 esterase-like activity of phytase family protein [Actinomycetospora sp. DW7H6]